jgi:Tol biopolymer transport system component
LSPDGKQIAFTDLLKKKNQIFILSMEGGEPIQLTKDKYGASNLNGPQSKKILFSSSIPLRDLLQDSILNPSKSIPTWKMEKPGFDKTSI